LSLVDPSTVATNVSLPPVVVDTVAGDTITEVTAGVDPPPPAAATVTTADADFVGSATLVAVTRPVPALVGAVYIPFESIAPVVAVHVTASFVVAPCTVAENCTFAPAAGDTAAGTTDTDATLGLPAAALPFSDTTTGRWRESVMMARLPFTVPAVAAVNFTVKLWL
jgi:hypothetical protein